MSEVLRGGDFSKEAAKEQESKKKINYLTIFDVQSGEEKFISLSGEETKRILEGRRPEIFSKEDLVALRAIEKEAFSEELREEIEDLAEELTSGGNIVFLFRVRGKLVGYLYAKPAPKAKENFRELGLESEYFDHSQENLYLESVAGKLGPWLRKIYTLLEEQAKRLGYRKISLHAINPRLIHPLQRKGFVTKKIIPDWLGHQAEYMEKEIER